MNLLFKTALPFVLVAGFGCSSASNETDDQAAAGASSPAGTGGQPPTAGAAGTLGSSGSSATAGSNSGSGGAAGSGAGGAGGTPSHGGTAGNNGGGASNGGAQSGGAGGGTGSGGVTAMDGKGLYDANCKACHGEQGVGGQLAPEIMHPVRDYATWVVRNGRAPTAFPGPMAAWGTDKLSDAQLMLIFDYVDQPPQPTTGKALFDDYCANCHGANGKGGPTMRDITNEVGNVLTMVRSGKSAGKFAMRRDYMPAFPAADISDAELMLIRDYVESL